MDFFQGYKTYIGIAISMMGVASAQMGWTWWADMAPQVQSLLNEIVQVVGLAIALYGNIMAKRREKKLQNGG